MKTIILAATVLSATAFTSCKKTVSECGMTEAKIIRYDCDRVIFQLLTNENIGDADWTDVQTHQQYSNVVPYYNTCAVNAITNGEIATLYVTVKKVVESNYDIYCNQCKVKSNYPPQTKVDFISISTEPCNSNAFSK